MVSAEVLKWLREIQSTDMVLPTTDGRQLRLRLPATLEAAITKM